MTGDPEFTVLVGSMADSALVDVGTGDAPVHEIASVDDLERVIVELTDSASAIVAVRDPALLESVVGEFRRVGRVSIRRPTSGDLAQDPVLSGESAALLGLLAEGLSLGEAASRLHLSRRTADRRLAEAKRALGAGTTPQAVASFLDRQRRSESSGRREPPLLGRNDEVEAALAAVASDRTVLIVGEGGVGKTALLRTVARLDGRDARAGSALATMQWREYWPLCRALRVTELVGDPEAVASAVETASGPDVLVLDDLHLADGATLGVVASLVDRAAILCACRPEGDSGQRVIDLLREAGALIVDLCPLGDEDARTLLRSVAPDLPDDRADAIVAGAGGLPLLIEFLGGVDDDAPLGRGLIPAVEALSDVDLQLAALLSLAGQPLECDGAALASQGFVVPVDGGRFRIRHQLIADAVLDRSSASVLTAAHAALATRATSPGQAAQHWLAAGEGDQARRDALAAAAESGSASERARLLALAASCLGGEEGTHELVQAAQELAAAGLYDEAVAVVDGLRIPATEVTLCAHVQLIRARAAWHSGDADAAVRHARAGLALAGGTDSAVEASLLVESVRCEALSTGIVEAHEDRLARAATIIGDGRGRGALLNVAAILPYFREGTGLSEWHEGLDAALAEGDTDTLMRCANNIIMWNESSGDPAAALEMATTMIDQAASHGLGAWELQFTAAAANLQYHQGRLTEAMPLLDRVLSETRDVRTREQAAIVRYSILVDLGLLEAVREVVPALPEGARQDWLHDDGLFCVHAALELAAGRPSRVLDIAALLAKRAPTDSSIWVFVVPLRAWAQHDLERHVDEVVQRSPIPLIDGLFREAQGVALLAEDPGAACDILDEAAALGLRWSRPQGLRAQWGAAEAARLAGRDDALARLLAVESAVAELGMEPLLGRVHRSLRRAGVRRAARRTLDRSGLLTERERLVLDLLGRGATYTEIARRLGVGRPTVRHLGESAQMKLGAGSRSAAVAVSATV